jgi:hypothetical protein
MHYLSRVRNIRRSNCAPSGEAPRNQELFNIYLVIVSIAILLALLLPSHAEELRDRLNWEAPPALVADILIREAVDRGVTEPRCLKARTHVLESVGVDRERDIERMRDNLAPVTDRF